MSFENPIGWPLMFLVRQEVSRRGTIRVARQLRRAARSIPANIAEGWAKRASAAEIKRFLQVAIGSCDECKQWLEMSRDEGFLGSAHFEDMSNRFNVLGAMLKSLWKHWQSFAK